METITLQNNTQREIVFSIHMLGRTRRIINNKG